MVSVGKVIDFHTHYYPEGVAADPKAFARTSGELFWGELVCPPDSPSLQGWATVESMLADMDEAGVDHSVLQGWYWENIATCEQQIQWYGDIIREHGDRFFAFAPVNPSAVQPSLNLLKQAVDLGFRGIGELHPGVQGFGLGESDWFPIVEFAIEQNWPVLLHVTEPVGRPYTPRRETDFRAVQSLIERYPELQLVLAHWGGLIFAHELNPYIAKTWKNVYYDTAATPLLYQDKVYSLAADILKSGKVIFGSDYPLKVYPGEPECNPVKRMLDGINHLEIAPDKLTRWRGMNAANLLRLE
jgi:predicted TIM-barrel fold metal-dependent hydrolase